MPDVSVQSVRPVAAAPSAPSRPTPTAMRAPRRSPSASSASAAVQAPIGTSVITGCKLWPSQVPLSASLSGCFAAPAASYAPFDGAGQRVGRRVEPGRPQGEVDELLRDRHGATLPVVVRVDDDDAV